MIPGLLIGGTVGALVGLVLGVGVAAARLPAGPGRSRGRTRHTPGVAMGPGQVRLPNAPAPQVQTTIPTAPPRPAGMPTTGTTGGAGQAYSGPQYACDCGAHRGQGHLLLCATWEVQ